MRQVSKGNMITDTCNERTVVSFKAQEIEKVGVQVCLKVDGKKQWGGLEIEKMDT